MRKKIIRSKLEARVLDAAIESFAESGFDGASARAIAREAGSTTMPLYHSFKNKKELFSESLEEVAGTSLDPSQLVLCFYEDQPTHDARSLLLSGLLRWYAALPRSHVRLLMFARLAPQNDWRTTAEAAMQELIAKLTKTIEREAARKPRQKLSGDIAIAAQAMILLLLQLKATSPTASSPRGTKEGAANIESLLAHLIKGLGPAFSD